jgi:hypothetical protein
LEALFVCKLTFEKAVADNLCFFFLILLQEQFFWAFLLAARRSRRATGYAIASVLRTMLRMPSACLTQKKCFFEGCRVYPPTPVMLSSFLKYVFSKSEQHAE